MVDDLEFFPHEDDDVTINGPGHAGPALGVPTGGNGALVVHNPKRESERRWRPRASRRAKSTSVVLSATEDGD